MIGKYLYLFYRGLVGLLPSCIRGVTIAWWKDLTNIINISGTLYVEESIGTRIDTVYYGQYLSGGVSGVLNWDGLNDYVSLSSIPDITGTKTIGFYLYLTQSSGFSNNVIMNITPTPAANDRLTVFMDGSNICVNLQSSSSSAYSISGREDEVLFVEFDKSQDGGGSGVMDDFRINGISQVDLTSGTTWGTQGATIGANSAPGNYLSNAYIWNININNEHAYLGYPSGNQDSAWADTIGSINGTVNGSPSTTNVLGGSVINLYRTTGTYNYIDPSDGSASTGNSIPANGLITIPVNGICEITTSDGSRYPICERAGGVLHDVTQNHYHISVTTPSWSETLYGSDYLNQCGFLDKETSDSLGYIWQTNVNGGLVVLDDDCLKPSALEVSELVTADSMSVTVDSVTIDASGI